MHKGFVLLPVVMLIVLLATAILLLTRDNASGLASGASQVDVAEARYVAEAGLRHATWKVSTTGTCSAYTDLVNQPFGNHSYSAAYSSSSGSPIDISATGTSANGAIRQASAVNQKVFQPPVTTTLQPDAAGEDTYIRDGANDSNNFGASTILKLNNASAEEASLLKFDLSGLPAGAEVVSATLELWLEDGISISNGIIDAHQVTQAWVEGDKDGQAPPAGAGATYMSYNGQNNWANEGGDYVAAPLDTTTITSLAQEWHQWDISAAAKAWINGAAANNGVLLRASGGDVDKIYFTSGDGSAATRPRLTIIFACECGVVGSSGSTVLQPGTAAGKDAGVNQQFPTYNYGTATVTVVNTSGTKKHGLLHFDLSGLPSGATVDSAELELYLGWVDSTFFGRVAVHRMLQPWTEGIGDNWQSGDGATWNTSDGSASWAWPGNYDSASVAQKLVIPGSGWHTWNVTSLVAGWQNGSYPNDGLALVGGGALSNASFYSSDHGTATEHPKLTVNYSCPCGVVCSASQPGGGALAAGLIAHWKLDETSGTTALDSVGGHDGTLKNGPVWTAGKLDGGLSFDGSNDYIDVSSMNPMSYDDFTVSAWYKSAEDSVDDDEYIFEHNENFVNELTFGPTDDGTDDRLRFGFSRAGNWSPHYGTSDIVDQQWHLVVGVRSSGRMKLYVDGVLETDEADAHAGQTITVNGDGPFIGDLPGNTEQVDGTLDDVRLYDRALTAAEISELFALGGGASGDYYLDEFPDFSCDGPDEYQGSNGTLDWSTQAWVESGDDGRACGANFRVTDDPNIPDADGNRLRLQNKNRSVTRQVDLSSFTAATLSFDYRRDDMSDSANVQVQLSGNGGSDWTTVLTIPPGSDTEYQNASQDISAFIAVNTMIRFFVDDNFKNEAYIDNVRIDGSGSGGSGGGNSGGGSGSVTYEGYAEAKLSNEADSLNVNKPAGTAAGDLLIAVMVTDGQQKPEMSVTGGWTLIDHDDQNKKVTMDVWWKIAGPSEPSGYSFGWAKSQEAYGWIMRFSGHDPANPIHATANGGGKSESPTTPAVNTTVPNAMIVRIGGFDGNEIEDDEPGLGGHTIVTMDGNNNGPSGGAGYVSQPATGNSGTANFSLDDDEEYRAVTIAIAPAAVTP